MSPLYYLTLVRKLTDKSFAFLPHLLENVDAAYSLAFLHSRMGNMEAADSVWAHFKATSDVNNVRVEELEKTLMCITR